MIFRLAFLFSLVIHTAVYCSVRIWPEILSPGIRADPAAVTMIEVGLIQPAPLSSAPAAKEKKSKPRPEEYALKSIKKSSPEELRLDTPPGSRPAPEGRAGSASRSGGEMAGPELELIRKKIESVLYYPRRARLQRLEGEVKVGFSLTPAGELLHEEVIDPSPYQVLNQAALLIMKKAAPFGPVQPKLSGRELSIPIKFKSSY